MPQPTEDPSFPAAQPRTSRARAARPGGTALPACVLCETVRGAAARYVTRVLGDPGHAGTCVESIVDALGFCPAHGALIVRHGSPGGTLDKVLRRSAAGIRALLEGGPILEDRLLGIFFSAGDACPACRYVERQMAGLLGRHAEWLRRSPGRSAGAGRPLCMPHFMSLIGDSELRDLPAWVAVQRDLLSSVAPALDRGAEPETAAAYLVAGDPEMAHACMPDEGGPADGEFSCSVCLAVRRVLLRWLDGAQCGVRFGIATWAVLPTCAHHIWMCRLSGDAPLAREATRNGFEAALRALRRGAATLEREERRLAEESLSVWFKRKSPAYHLAQRRKAITAMPRCVACGRVGVARDRAIGEILERLGGRRHRAALDGQIGLCVKHFAQARIIAPAGPVRDALTEAQVARLHAIEAGDANPAAAWLGQAVRILAGHP